MNERLGSPIKPTSDKILSAVCANTVHEVAQARRSALPVFFSIPVDLGFLQRSTKLYSIHTVYIILIFWWVCKLDYRRPY